MNNEVGPHPRGSGALFTRDEVLGGMPAKRARNLLFLIESRAAHLVARSRQVSQVLMREEGARQREYAFLEAFTLGKEPPLRPTIQDLERVAAQWAHLVPDNAQLRAAVGHLIGEKYCFTQEVVPGVRAALGLDGDAVRQSYHRLYGVALDSIFQPRLPVGERLRWASAAFAARLCALPPFWLAFALTVGVSFPQAVLALPIAAASAGPLATLVLLALIGLLNIVTTTCLAESVVRSGPARYGGAFLGRLVEEYLGGTSASILTAAVFIFGLMVVAASFVGMSSALAHFTGVPPLALPAILLLITMFFLSRRLAVTVNLMLALGTLSALLLLVLAAAAAGSVRLEHLRYVDPSLLGGRPFSPEALGLVVGVVLSCFFAQIMLTPVASMVLPRERTGRALIWGSAAGVATLMLFAGIWVLAVNGAVAPQALVGQQGTAVEALAAQLGPGAAALGSALVVIVLGLTALRASTVSYGLVSERIPTGSRPIVTMARGTGRLVLRPVGRGSTNACFRLAYMGLAAGKPQFRLEAQLEGSVHTFEVEMDGPWDIRQVADRLPEAQKNGIRLALEPLDATNARVRLRLRSRATLSYEGSWDAGNDEAAAGGDEDSTLLATAPSPRAGRRAADLLFSPRGRFLLASSPVVLSCLLAEWILLTSWQSYAGINNLAGIVTASLIAGIFPVLLLASSRRRGDLVPAVAYRFIGHPVLGAAIYALFVANLFAHGLSFWQDPLERGAALFSGVAVIGVTAAMVRGGAFRPRLAVELRQDLQAGAKGTFAVVAAGRPAEAEVRLDYPDGEQRMLASSGEVPVFGSLRAVTVRVASGRARELKVWAHRVTLDGASEPLPAQLEVPGKEVRRYDLKLSGGQVVLPITGDECQIRITLPEAAEQDAPPPARARARQNWLDKLG